MLPSQFKRLIETLRSRLSAVHEAIDKQESAIRDASKTADENRQEIPRIIASAIMQASEKDVPTYEKTQRDKEYRQQSRLIFVTFLAFLAASIYAGIAAYQACLMHRTYTEIQGQTKAAQQAAYAACVNAQIAREALIQEQTNAMSTQIEANDSTEQALATIESERASPMVTFFPPGNTPTNAPLELKLAVENEGKANAGNVDLKTAVVLVPHHSIPKFSYQKSDVVDLVLGPLKGGETYPPTTRYEGRGTLTNAIEARTEKGAPITADAEAIAAIEYRRVLDIVVYGTITYSDFTGSHWRHFCKSMRFLDPGANNGYAGFTKDEKRCIAYDTQTDHQQFASLRPAPNSTQQPKQVPEVNCQITKP